MNHHERRFSYAVTVAIGVLLGLAIAIAVVLHNDPYRTGAVLNRPSEDTEFEKRWVVVLGDEAGKVKYAEVYKGMEFYSNASMWSMSVLVTRETNTTDWESLTHWSLEPCKDPPWWLLDTKLILDGDEFDRRLRAQAYWHPYYSHLNIQKRKDDLKRYLGK